MGQYYLFARLLGDTMATAGTASVAVVSVSFVMTASVGTEFVGCQ